MRGDIVGSCARKLHSTAPTSKTVSAEERAKRHLNARQHKNITILVVMGILIVFLFFLSVGFGAVQIGPGQIIEALFTHENNTHYQIIWNVRLPRTLVAILVGMALAVAGAILQSVMRNPLATPNIIGVSGGAGVTALAIMILFPNYFYLVPAGAFIGAFCATIFIYVLAWRDGVMPTRLLLAGVAMNTIFGAGNDILISLYPDKVEGTISFMVGGLSGTNWNDVKMIFPYIASALAVVLLFSSALNILSLGDEVATSLGMRVEATRLTFIVIASVLAGAAVSAVGLLGFVGLIVPHIARMIMGTNNRYLIPASILLGGSVLMGADLVARIIFAPLEIPAGIIMSILGGPFFLYLLRTRELTK